MKKVFMAALALTMAVFVSCSKDDLNVENNDVKVNFTVAEKPSFDTDTRAVKTKWANGDQILVFLGTKEDIYTIRGNSSESTITLSYNGSTWTGTTGTLDAAIASVEGGNYLAVHYRGEVGLGTESNYNVTLKNYNGGEYMTYKGTYTKTGDVIELGELSLAYPEGAMYVSVKGFASMADKEWRMMILNENYAGGYVQQNTDFTADAFKAGELTVNSQTVSIRGANNKKGSSSVVNGNDLSFFFIDKAGTSSKYTFYLVSDEVGYFAYTTTSSVEGNKAYLLPELTIEGGDVAAGCKWYNPKTSE